jgi:hypothetical protein
LIVGLMLGAITLLMRADTPAWAQGNYSPASDVTLSSNASSGIADTTYTLNVPSGDLNFGGVTIQLPQAACVAPGPEPAGGNCAAGPRPNLGDVVGTFSSSVFVGLNNSTCSGNIPLTFIFLNATVDNSPGNLIYPSTQAQADSGGNLSPLLHDVNAVGPGSGQSEAGAVSPLKVSQGTSTAIRPT